MNTQETKETLEKFRAWIIRLNRDLKDPELVRKYMDENPDSIKN